MYGIISISINQFNIILQLFLCGCHAFFSKLFLGYHTETTSYFIILLQNNIFWFYQPDIS